MARFILARWGTKVAINGTRCREAEGKGVVVGVVGVRQLWQDAEGGGVGTAWWSFLGGGVQERGMGELSIVHLLCLVH